MQDSDDSSEHQQQSPPRPKTSKKLTGAATYRTKFNSIWVSHYTVLFEVERSVSANITTYIRARLGRGGERETVCVRVCVWGGGGGGGGGTLNHGCSARTHLHAHTHTHTHTQMHTHTHTHTGAWEYIQSTLDRVCHLEHRVRLAKANVDSMCSMMAVWCLAPALPEKGEQGGWPAQLGGGLYPGLLVIRTYVCVILCSDSGTSSDT